MADSRTADNSSVVSQTYYVFERKFYWRCYYLVPLILFSYMVTMITLEIYFAIRDFKEGQSSWAGVAQMFAVFGGLGIIGFGMVAVMWPKSVTILLDKKKDRMVVQYTHMFNK